MLVSTAATTDGAYHRYECCDLFDDDILSKAPQSKQLREDNRGRPYIRGVKEAIELLNMESSRSHSVLSMRLVQFENDISPTSLTKDDLAINTINFVHHPGSERVKEAGNINSSLMILRHCFETLRENQSQ
ncbi:unnamed protein product [Adineta ricciae]|uniref:Kinesin motor domain-containing protein n=1 Tax=Adineta ricciae TaxID=249248 RepID=A0A815FZY7_ADIRI|nr:unnamed protein product [Adineta ricciae]